MNGLLSYASIKYTGPLKQWQVLFLLVGAVTFAWSLLCFWLLPNSPVRAWWLTDRQKVIAVNRTAENRTGVENKVFKWGQVKEAFLDPRTHLHFLLSLTLNVPNSGLTTFNSVIINSLGFSKVRSTLFGRVLRSLTLTLRYSASTGANHLDGSPDGRHQLGRLDNFRLHRCAERQALPHGGRQRHPAHDWHHCSDMRATLKPIRLTWRLGALSGAVWLRSEALITYALPFTVLHLALLVALHRHADRVLRKHRYATFSLRAWPSKAFVRLCREQPPLHGSVLPASVLTRTPDRRLHKEADRVWVGIHWLLRWLSRRVCLSRSAHVARGAI